MYLDELVESVAAGLKALPRMNASFVTHALTGARMNFVETGHTYDTISGKHSRPSLTNGLGRMRFQRRTTLMPVRDGRVS